MKYNQIFNKTSLLICSDSKYSLDIYKSLFEKNFTNIELYTIDNIKINFSQFDIILVDLNVLKKLSLIQENLSSLSKNKLILISPISNKKLLDFTYNLNYFHLIFSKPIDTKKLISQIIIFAEEIENNLLLKNKNSILIDSLNQLPIKVSIFDSNQKFFFGNKKFMKEKDLTFKDYEYKTFDLLSEENFSELFSKLNYSNNSTVQLEKQLNEAWIRTKYFKSKDDYLICLEEDVTAEKLKERRLEQSAIFFEHSNEGIMITDKNNTIVSVNKAFCKITGYTKDDIIGKTPSLLRSGMQSDNFYNNMWSSLESRNQWQGEIWNKRKNGEIYPEWLSISKVKSIDFNEEYFIAIFTDLTSLKEADKKVFYYANHDALTGLSNRHNFDNKLTEIINHSEKGNKKFALYFIDIDNFKYVNDTYGHDVGDEIIKIVAKRIQKTIRETDYLARIGGDEFTLIQTNIKNESDIEIFARKIMEKVNQVIKIKDKYFYITLSIGISVFPDDAHEKKDLLKMADTAMYVVKEEGRNGFKLFNISYTEIIERKFNIQNDLRVAIVQEDIEIYFQPFFDLKKNILGAEVLARWFHKDRGAIPPSEFVSIAEDCDLISDLTRLILKKSCEAMVNIKQKIKNGKFILAVNISGKHFYSKNFEEEISSIIDDFSLTPNDFELELTETYLMNNHNRSVNIVNSMKKKGFSFALDDFGTGYSSLNYLKNFSVNKLKIDKSFVDDCEFDNNDVSIIKTIIQMGKIFGFKVQAEGVENKNQLNILADLGCDYIQGYYFSKPLKYSSLMELIND